MIREELDKVVEEGITVEGAGARQGIDAGGLAWPWKTPTAGW